MDRLRIQLARAKKRDEACKPTRQCLGKCFVLAQSLILQPQAQDDERVRRAVEFAVKSGDELVTPQDWQGVVAELALVLGLVDLQHVVEVKYNLGAPAGDHLIPRPQEDDLFRCGRLQRSP